MAGYTPQKKHDPIDETVVLPAAIRAAAARSDALHKQMYEPAPEAGTEPAPVAEAPKVAEPAPAPAPAPVAEAPKTPKADAQPEDFEHKYNSLKGRHDTQQQAMVEMRRQIADLQARAAAPAAPAAPNPDLQFKPISAEDREAYGEDFLDVAARAAFEKLNPEFSSLKQQLAELQGNVRNVSATTAQDRKAKTMADLTAAQPDWLEINVNPDFIAWTSLQDPLSGAIRQDMLRDAFNRGDVSRVLLFFRSFLSDEAASDPAKRQPSPPQGKVPLETFAAPGRAKAPAASSAPGEPETITHAQIANFYMLVNKNHYRGNDAEKNRLEQMIFDAQREGRVV